MSSSIGCSIENSSVSTGRWHLSNLQISISWTGKMLIKSSWWVSLVGQEMLPGLINSFCGSCTFEVLDYFLLWLVVISVYFSFLHQLLTDLHNLTEILLKAVLNTINLALYLSARFFYEEIFNFEKNRIVFQWNPYCTVWRCYLMQIKKSTCPRTGRKWLSNVWNMPWVLHVKVTLEQRLMSNGLLGHWWPVAVQIVHSISFSPLVTKCSLYPIISPYGKMFTLSHYLPLWKNVCSIPLSTFVAKHSLYCIISPCIKMSTLSHYLPLCQNVHSISLSPLVAKFPLYPNISPYGKTSTLSHYLPLWQNIHTIPLSPLMAKCRLYPIISRCGKMSTLSHYLPLWQNVHSITLFPLVSKFPLYPIISTYGKMSTLSLYLLLWQNVHSPIMSPYDKMSTLSHYLPLWQNVDYHIISPCGNQSISQ